MNGYVVSLRSVAKRFWAKVKRGPRDACWPWAASTRRGYGQFSLRRGQSAIAHRFAWELVHGTVPENLYVLHSCDNPRCCNTRHLYLGTQKNNMEDVRARGREGARKKHRGEAVPTSLLTAKDVREIRRRYRAGGVTQKTLAREYLVAQSMVCVVLQRRSWKHL